MASIQKTPSSTWQVRYRDDSGKHRARTFKRKVDAQKFLHRVQAAIDDGSHINIDRGAVPVVDWVRDHYGSRSDLAATTRARTDGIIRQHIAPKWADTTLAQLSHGDVQKWVRELIEADQSSRSVKKIVNVMSSALDVAVRDRRISSNPCQGVRYPKVDPKPKIFLTATQVEQLASVVFDREKVIVYTLAYTGLRWGELAGLRVKDIDPLRRRLTVEQTIVDVNGRLVVKPPKDHEIRSVPVPGFVMGMLVEQIAGRGPEDLVFTSPRGTALRNRNERVRWFDRAAEAIGEPDLTPHGLRHTAASLAISSGASVLGVQRMLGHSTPTVTLEVYSSLFDSDLDEVAERLDRVRADSRVRDLYVNSSPSSLF